MSKYTKGPWEVGKYPNGVETHIYCDDATGSAIACADFRYVDRPKEEIAANLRLMATSPQLYEVLKAIHDAYYVGHKTDAGFVKAMSYFADDMKAALAKAVEL